MALAVIPFRLTMGCPNAFLPHKLSQAPCHMDQVVFPRETSGFTLFRVRAAGGRLCPSGISCLSVRAACLSVCGKKCSKILRLGIWPVPCDGFLRIIIGLPFVRASATSRIASPATLPSVQSKADANQANEASPFALLVGQVQAKPAAQQNDTQSKDSASGKPSDTSTASQSSGTDAATQAAATQAASQAAVKPVKTDKSDGKNDDKNIKNDSGDTTTDPADATAQALAQANQQQASQQQAALQANAQPQPPVTPGADQLSAQLS